MHFRVVFSCSYKLGNITQVMNIIIFIASISHFIILIYLFSINTGLNRYF